MKTNREALTELEETIVDCRLCPRLVMWRTQTAKTKVKRFIDEEYWGKPVPGFGDPSARLLIVGLAPAAHGGNRTGRMFTGDSSGAFLFSELHKFGFANRPYSISKDDDLKVKDCFITAVTRCAPPMNRPLKEELYNCNQFLRKELKILSNLKVILTLGRIAFDEVVKMYYPPPKRKNGRILPFKHGSVYSLNEKLVLISSYHPSQRNTLTRKLTVKMFDEVLQKVKEQLKD